MYVGDISFYFTANSDELIFISCANNTVGNSLWFGRMGKIELKAMAIYFLNGRGNIWRLRDLKYPT